MDPENPICYLSFPDDSTSTDAAASLRVALGERGIDVLPPEANDWSSMTSMRPFHWLRQSDFVVVDITGDSSWVAFEAGAAHALNKRLILVAQSADASSPIEGEIARSFLYDTENLEELADYVRQLAPGADR